MSNKYYYFKDRKDGFGAQFQTLLTTLLFCEYNKLNFLYRGINSIEHNYENDPNYINEIDELMNIKNNYNYEKNMDTTNIVMTEITLQFRNLFDTNLDKYLASPGMVRYKEIFWKNKNRNVYDNGKMNIAVHIRNYCTEFDVSCGRVNLPLDYYFNVMKLIRKRYNKDMIFHIYSIGNPDDFKKLENPDVVFHINENISKTFIGMVAADALIMSRSSLSYVAAFLSDGDKYYAPFWHPPAKHWFVFKP